MDRRTFLAGMLLSTSIVSLPALAAGPEVYEVTPELIAAAKAEGVVVFYTSLDVAAAEKLAAAFEQKYAGIKVKVERSGSERVFQRIGQEYGSNIRGVDVAETSDAVHFAIFKKNGWLTQSRPMEVDKLWPETARDKDGAYAAFRAHLSVIAYNTKQVKAEDAPKSFADLLLPKWKGRMVKAHPGYSGTVMTGTHALLPVLGWDYFKKLGQQRIMQVQSSTEPPKKLAQGERSVEADGNEYNVFMLKESGAPLEVIYAAEGTPITVGNAALFKSAPHPNAAKLLYAFLFSKHAQQLCSDVGGLRSFHPGVVEKPVRTPLSKIKLLYSDPDKLINEVEEIKKKYEEYFGT